MKNKAEKRPCPLHVHNITYYLLLLLLLLLIPPFTPLSAITSILFTNKAFLNEVFILLHIKSYTGSPTFSVFNTACSKNRTPLLFLLFVLVLFLELLLLLFLVIVVVLVEEAPVAREREGYLSLLLLLLLLLLLRLLLMYS